MDDKKKDYNHGLMRGLQVIMAFDKNNPKLTNAEISSRIGVSRAAVRRTLLTLVDLGYMVQDKRQFQLTPKVLDIGFSCLSSMHIGDRVQFILDRISNETQESCALGFPDNTEIRYMATSNAENRKIPLTLSVGTTIPMINTAMGKVYLSLLDNKERDSLISASQLSAAIKKKELQAQLKEIGDIGYAVSEGNYEIGINGIAIPILNKNEKIVATLGIVANGIRAPREVLVEDFLPVLSAYSGEISQALI